MATFYDTWETQERLYFELAIEEGNRKETAMIDAALVRLGQRPDLIPSAIAYLQQRQQELADESAAPKNLPEYIKLETKEYHVAA